VKNCGTCIHWRKIEDAPNGKSFALDEEGWPLPYGECKLIDENSTDLLAWTYAANEAVDVSLMTHPFFSCFFWNGDEEEKEKVYGKKVHTKNSGV